MRQVYLLGRAGSDGELKYTQNGTPCFNVSIAVSEKRADAVETHWFDITAWGKVAEIAKETVKKGHEIFINGKLQTRSWTDKNNNKVSKTDVVALQMRVIPKRGEQQAAPGAYADQGNFPDMNQDAGGF